MISTVPIGTLTRKIPRQDQYVTKMPPSTGPTMPPIGKMLVNMAEGAVPVPAELVGHDAGCRRHERAAAERLDAAQRDEHVDVVGSPQHSEAVVNSTMAAR